MSIDVATCPTSSAGPWRRRVLAFEVADLAEHISARIHRLRDADALLDGFALDERQRERAEAYRIVLATMWLLEVLPGNRGEALNPEGSATLQADHLLGLLDPEATI